MNKVAIGFLTKDRVDLSKQTAKVLVEGRHALFWFDGSSTECGQKLAESFELDVKGLFMNVRGGADPAVAFALHTMLMHPAGYTHVGLVENDVLLHPGWFGPTMALFERGAADGLEVGAVSARCYADRILIQRDGYALMHNLGWGTQVMTRQAAEIALGHMRTPWTTENRRTFMQLSGLDIARWWAFRNAEQWLVCDWQNDALLARHGLASLALVPSPVEMIGQHPPLHVQGLRIATEPVELLRDDHAFARFAARTDMIRFGEWSFDVFPFHRADDGSCLVFAHQLRALDAVWEGDWRLRWVPGFGGFAWRAGDGMGEDDMPHPHVTINVSGPCEVLCAGPGALRVEDTASGYVIEPVLPEDNGQVMSIVVPADVSYRGVRVTALLPGVTIYGLRCRDAQPHDPTWRFDHFQLPPC